MPGPNVAAPLGFAVFALAAFTGGAAPAHAASYVVAPGGDDAKDGITTPWKTLGHAAATVQPGDTVQVRAGNYAGFDLRMGGTAQSPISFIADPGAVINQANKTTTDGINLEGTAMTPLAYVAIQGFKVSGVPRNGIRTVLCHHVTIRGNNTDGNGVRGIFTSHCDDLLIEQNSCSHSGKEHGIYVSNACVRPVVRRNVSFSNAGAGIHMNGDLSQGGNGLILDALVEENVIYDNGRAGGSGINCDGVQSSVFQNNLLYGNHASGISLFQIDAAEGARNNLIVNNTIVMASDGRWALNIQNASTGNTVYNNIIYDHHSFHGSLSISPDSLPGLTMDWNAVMDRYTTDDASTILTLAAWRAKTGQDAHSLVATPDVLFVSEMGSDFHLKAGSPAVDKGTAMRAPGHDLDGIARPQGAGFDIGAYEACGLGGCQDPKLVDGGVDSSVDLAMSGQPDAAGGDGAALDAGPHGAVGGGCGCRVSTRSQGGSEPAVLLMLGMSAVLCGLRIRGRRGRRYGR